MSYSNGPSPMSRRRMERTGSSRSNGRTTSASTNSSFQHHHHGSRVTAAQHDDAGNMIDDSPVVEFTALLNKLPAEHWRERTGALEDLLSKIPDVDHDDHGIIHWYKSPPTLRRLSYPLSTLLMDQRSSVVKHVTQHIALLVHKTNSLDKEQVEDGKSHKRKGTADYCKYLMKDLLPTILSLHGQTVNIIRACTTNMMVEIIPQCRFKSGLPILLERLRKDKSRDVREACVRYLKIITQSWHHTIDNGKGNAYLTRDVCMHIGNAVGRALMDQSQLVRMEARQTFEIFREVYPKLWHEIVHKQPDGIFSKDLRLQKTLINAAVRADAEKSLGNENASTPYDFDDGSSVGSIQSRYSTNSRLSIYSQSRDGRSVYSGYRPSTTSSVTSRPRPAGKTGDTQSRHIMSPQRPSTPSNIPSPHMSRAEIEAVRRREIGRESPISFNPVASSAYTSSRNINVNDDDILSVQRKIDSLTVTNKDVTTNSATRIQAAFRGFSTRSSILHSNTKVSNRIPSKNNSSRPPLSSPPAKFQSPSRLGRTAEQMARRRQTVTPKNACPPHLASPAGSINSQNIHEFNSPSPRMMKFHDQPHPSARVLNVTTLSPPGEMSSLDADAVIARAKSRKSSIMLQRRLKRNSNVNNLANAEYYNNDRSRINTDVSGSEMNEKVMIAHQLLTAHKCYIDELMEGLKLEMDCIRDFEFLLEPNENGHAGSPIGLTEDQILSYFESMVQFLDKSSENANKLRYRIDQVCRAGPTDLSVLSPESQGGISNMTPPTEI